MVSELLFWYDFGIFRQVSWFPHATEGKYDKCEHWPKKWQERGREKIMVQTAGTVRGVPQGHFCAAIVKIPETWPVRHIGTMLMSFCPRPGLISPLNRAYFSGHDEQKPGGVRHRARSPPRVACRIFHSVRNRVQKAPARSCDKANCTHVTPSGKSDQKEP
jgi:hypothetical protein